MHLKPVSWGLDKNLNEMKFKMTEVQENRFMSTAGIIGITQHLPQKRLLQKTNMANSDVFHPILAFAIIISLNQHASYLLGLHSRVYF